MAEYLLLTLVVFLLAILANQPVGSDRILVASPITSHSHTNVFKPLVRALVERGHDVTYWNGLRPDPFMLHLATSNSSMTQGSLTLMYSDELDRFNNGHSERVGFGDIDSPIRLLMEFPERTVQFCRNIYSSPHFHQLLSSKNFDLVIADGVFNDCVLPLIGALDAPFVYLNCFAPTPWLLDAVGSPLALATFPHPAFNFRGEMNWWQRTVNTLVGMAALHMHRWAVLPTVDRMAATLHPTGGKFKSAAEIQKKQLSMLFVNTHLSINYPLPTSPAVVQVGGMHCRPARPLPQDLVDFIYGDGMDQDGGFIVVSFGSILKGAAMPDKVRRVFLNTFARLPPNLKVIWKWENHTSINADLVSNGYSRNIKFVDWLPQQDLLGHPRARLFITHGGLLSNQEAVYHGVPFIALPVFADQPVNAQKAHDDGYAIRLHWNRLSESVLYDAMAAILSNGSSAANSSGSSWPSPSPYVQRMNRISNLMTDQLDRPLDRAVYWIEYVIRHQGAPHLKGSARRLEYYQRGLVDVVCLLFAILGSILCILWIGCRTLFNRFIHPNIKIQKPIKTNTFKIKNS